MARLIVEDSEDEFPDLDTLLRGDVPAPARRKEAMSTLGSRDGEGKEKDEGMGKEDLSGSGSGIVKKKRVLKRRDDNPLLRPLGGGVKGKSNPKQLEKMTAQKSSSQSAGKNREEGEVPATTGSRRNGKKPTPIPDSDEEVVEKRVPSRPRSKHSATLEWEAEQDSDDLSDFIVNDSTFLEEEVSEIEKPPPSKPPRFARRLVKGRRTESEDEDLELEMRGLTVKDDAFHKIASDFDGSEDEDAVSQGKGSKGSQGTKSKTVKEAPRPKKKVLEPSSDIEDPFTLRFSPSENKSRKVSKTRFTTPPGTPELKPKTLISPKKLPRIPSSPHRPSMDDFWSQDVVNDWNDEYSPRKKLESRPKLQLDPNGDLSEGRLLFSLTKKSPVKQDRALKDAKKEFSHMKHALAESFLAELDSTITSNQISTLASATGGIKIIWSKKLNTTAGRANWKRETIRSSTPQPDGKPAPPTYRHHAAIELAEKVIDDEDRLLNVIAHEFCHLANFMVSNVKTNPHGKEFKAWAAKVSRRFADRGIEVTTKHSYTIDYKYVWECENCGLEFKRHSKSIDPSRHQCGQCKSKLVQTKPVPRGKGAGVSEYQAFVKANMRIVREENPGSPQKDMMRLVGKKYQEFKAGKLRGESVSVSVDEVVGSKEATPEGDELGLVVRKLDFLDLTSP